MGYFQVRYDSKALNYDRRGFIRLATEHNTSHKAKGRVKVSNKICQSIA